MKRLRFPRHAYNPLSGIGAFIALTSGLLMLFFLSFQFVQEEVSPYLGIVIYLVIPPFLLAGLVLIPVGMIRRKRLLEKLGKSHAPQWPHLDLNITTHRNALFVFTTGSVIFALISVVGGYQAYHYTESVDFCGEVCHTVMRPEHVAYRNSPHARVSCSACHVGEGAGWYAKSKLSGAYQVYAAAFKKYPRPIPTPIENLRPAQETCEKCHWPEKFFGGQQRQFNHYMYDEENTSWPTNLLIKTGGGDPKTGQTAGIHWHMNIGFKVEYIARDEKRQDIPWVRTTDSGTGRVTIYQDNDNPLSEEEFEHAELRVMDCMDCHNRPSHKFQSPDHLIDLAILTGQIDQDLPSIKRVAVEAMEQEYDTEEEAMRGIASSMLNFYKETMDHLDQEQQVKIEQAIRATQEQYSQSIFPEMKVRWSDYPDNIGHFLYKGCMRCHEGNHTSEEGWVLTKDCNSCHSILSQGSGERAQMASSPEGLEFVHPEDIGEMWRETGCYECHTGTQP
jgi:nitrate/TMAO reductase-like tetraheme cytochrome c subunit